MAKLGIRAYARTRGCPHTTVQKAIKSQRLVNCLSRDDKGNLLIDEDIANQEWELNTDKGKQTAAASRAMPAITVPHVKAQNSAPPAPDAAAPVRPNDPAASALNKSRAAKEAYAAKLAQLEYETKIGKLVPVEQVKDIWFKIITESKTKILALPAKIKSQIPHLTGEEVLLMEGMAREALEELAANAGY